MLQTNKDFIKHNHPYFSKTQDVELLSKLKYINTALLSDFIVLARQRWENSHSSFVGSTNDQLFDIKFSVLQSHIEQMNLIISSLLKAELKQRNEYFNLIIALFLFANALAFFVLYHTMRKKERIEYELQDEKEKSSVTLNSIGDAVISVDLNSLVTFINPVAENLTGWSNIEALGQPLTNIFNIINEETRLEVENPVNRCLKEGQVVGLANHTILIAKDGNELVIEDSAAPIRSNDNVIMGVVLVFHDVTESAQLTLELNYQTQTSSELWSLIEDSINEMYIFDENYYFIHVNKGARQNMGYSSAELETLTPIDIKPEFSREKFVKYVSPLIRGEQKLLNFETIHQRKDGSTYPVDVNLQYSSFKGKPVFVAFILDITNKRKTEEQLRQAQKMEAIGQLSGGIAHDFNNLLGIILGNLDLLKLMNSDNEKSLKKIEATHTAALRAADLTKQLLSFSRKQKHLQKTSDINQIIHDIDTLIVRSLTPEISVEYNLTNSPYLTDIDPGAFKDSILNLALNARDVMSEGGQLTIETQNKSLDQSYVLLNPDAKAGDYIECLISDTGKGITQEEIKHIFEPFYTTKPQGKGTGLGLSMVFAFVQHSQGYIKIYSELGIGTTFHLFLPRSDNKMLPAEADSSQKQSELPVGNELILVVDDEQGLRELACIQLDELGYTTLSANTGTEAIELLKQHKDINVLFSDVIMPGGINGYELAEQAELINPNIKVLLASGYTKKALVKNGQSRFSANLLSKPYSFNELAWGIRKTLEKSSDQ
jgi:PAS domain S-box-containing protein